MHHSIRKFISNLLLSFQFCTIGMSISKKWYFEKSPKKFQIHHQNEGFPNTSLIFKTRIKSTQNLRSPTPSGYVCDITTLPFFITAHYVFDKGYSLA